MIILPPAFKKELLGYVKTGGHLLLIGPGTAALFQSELGVALEGSPQAAPRFLDQEGALVATAGRSQAATLQGRSRPFGSLRASRQTRSPEQPAASITTLGKGQLAATYFDFSESYLNGRNPAAAAFLNSLARILFPEPIVELTGSTAVDVSVMQQGSKLAVNLVNTSGPHATVPILDTIAPVGPLSLTISARTNRGPWLWSPGINRSRSLISRAWCGSPCPGSRFTAWSCWSEPRTRRRGHVSAAPPPKKHNMLTNTPKHSFDYAMAFGAWRPLRFRQSSLTNDSQREPKSPTPRDPGRQQSGGARRPFHRGGDRDRTGRSKSPDTLEPDQDLPAGR